MSHRRKVISAHAVLWLGPSSPHFDSFSSTWFRPRMFHPLNMAHSHPRPLSGSLIFLVNYLYILLRFIGCANCYIQIINSSLNNFIIYFDGIFLIFFSAHFIWYLKSIRDMNPKLKLMWLQMTIFVLLNNLSYNTFFFCLDLGPIIDSFK